MRTVELVQAFLWTCDECGRDNFERAITIEPESIDKDELPFLTNTTQEEVADWISGGGDCDFLMAPQFVKCRYCDEVFDTSPC